MPPKAVSIVATGSRMSAAAAAASATTISIRGQCGRHRFSPASAATQPSDSASVAGFRLGIAARIAPSFSTSGPGSAPPSVSPRSGTIWLAKMMVAIPAVNPTVTG